MKTAKELQEIIRRGLAAEAEENRVAHEKKRAELMPLVNTVMGAIEALGFTYLGNWNNDKPETAGNNLSFTATLQAFPHVGKIVTATVRHLCTTAVKSVDVIRDNDTSTEMSFTDTENSPLNTDKFQVYLFMAVTERHPLSQMYAVLYDKAGNLRKKE